MGLILIIVFGKSSPYCPYYISHAQPDNSRYYQSGEDTNGGAQTGLRGFHRGADARSGVPGGSARQEYRGNRGKDDPRNINGYLYKEFGPGGIPILQRSKLSADDGDDDHCHKSDDDNQ
jgi:hypothetical protein